MHASSSCFNKTKKQKGFQIGVLLWCEMKSNFNEGKILNELIKMQNLTIKDTGSIWEKHFTSLILSHSLLSIFLITSNLVVIVGLVKTCGEMKFPHKLFLCSSICGMLTGLLIPFMLLMSLFIQGNDLFDGIVNIVYNIILYCEKEFLITTAVIRLISVKWPHYHVKKRNQKRIIVCEVVFLIFLVPPGSIFTSENDGTLWLAQGCIFLFVLLVVTILVVLCIKILLDRPSLNQLKADTSSSSKRDYNRVWKPIIRILTIQIAFIITHLPITVYSYYMTDQLLFKDSLLIQQTIEDSVNVEIMALWLYMLSEFYSGLNACLYMVQCKQIRQFYRQKILRRRKRNNRVRPTGSNSEENEHSKSIAIIELRQVQPRRIVVSA